MFPNNRKKINENPPPKNPDSYHCHIVLKNVLKYVTKSDFLDTLDYFDNSCVMDVKISSGYNFRFKLPVTNIGIRQFSESFHKFTIAQELKLNEVLLKNTNLPKLKEDHCTRCPETGTCKAFIMNNFLSKE